MNANGTNPVRLIDDPATDSLPRWSPDGSRIVFTSGRGGNSNIYVMSADGTDVVRLTGPPTSDGDADWSPDGSKIVFNRSTDIYVMNADGTGFVKLTDDQEGGYGPRWSPAGVFGLSPAKEWKSTLWGSVKRQVVP